MKLVGATVTAGSPAAIPLTTRSSVPGFETVTVRVATVLTNTEPNSTLAGLTARSGAPITWSRTAIGTLDSSGSLLSTCTWAS